MNESLTEAIKEAYACAPTNVAIIQTIEVRQEGIQAPIYLAQSFRDVVATDENGIERLFERGGFQFSLPPSNEEGFRSLNVAVDNIGRRVSDFITTAKLNEVPVQIIYRPYLSTDLTTPQMLPPLVLYLKNVQITAHQVTGQATFMDVVNKKFPVQLYTRERFPALG